MISNDPLANNRWRSLRCLTDTPSAFANPSFKAGPKNFEAVQQARVLVIGAGGLGCELLKSLALTGFQNIDVIDMDTIEISNLNRQFLFRKEDVGKPKAEVAAEFIRKRVQGCNIISHTCRIEDKPNTFYKKFNLVVSGLDTLAGRKWINETLCGLVERDPDGKVDPSTVIPLIDGGTEGLKGNVRVIYPHMSACIDCTLNLFPPEQSYPICTIGHLPTRPEHLIQYISTVAWPQFLPCGPVEVDPDNPEHVTWILEKAVHRSLRFEITGLNRELVYKVLKRIVPAVSSTNAAIGASCALEAFKIITKTSKPMNNYLNFTQLDGAFTGVVWLGKDEDCVTCNDSKLKIVLDITDSLQMLLDRLIARFHLRNPQVETKTEKLYILSAWMPQLEEISRFNLKRRFIDMIKYHDEVSILDATLSKPIKLDLTFII